MTDPKRRYSGNDVGYMKEACEEHMKTVTLNTKGMKGPIETVEELVDRLRRHDYTYAMSDDHRVWLSGSNDRKMIQNAAAELGCKDLLLWWDVFQGRVFWAGSVLKLLENLKNGGTPSDFAINYCIEAMERFINAGRSEPDPNPDKENEGRLGDRAHGPDRDES